jgi:hypothetical protein
MIRKIFSITAILLFVTAIVLPGCSKEEEIIENWILGTWNVDKYVQQDFEDGQLTSESESTNQGKIVFREDGTGEDIGGNFMGSVFTWTNTDKTLTLTQEQKITNYDIESYSTSNFVFSITDTYPGGKSVERWYFSK